MSGAATQGASGGRSGTGGGGADGGECGKGECGGRCGDGGGCIGEGNDGGGRNGGGGDGGGANGGGGGNGGGGEAGKGDGGGGETGGDCGCGYAGGSIDGADKSGFKRAMAMMTRIEPADTSAAPEITRVARLRRGAGLVTDTFTKVGCSHSSTRSVPCSNGESDGRFVARCACAPPRLGMPLGWEVILAVRDLPYAS
jgi:hypothetical protein